MRSKEVKLKCRSGRVVKAKRVPPDVHDQFCQCWLGAVLLKPGTWIVELPGGDLPMSDQQIRSIFEPCDTTLLRRWNRV